MSIAVFGPDQLTVDAQIRRQRAASATAITTIFTIAVVVAGIARLSGDSASTMAFSLLVMGCAAIVWSPRLGIYFIAFFALVGDADTTPWYPFTKNLSSAESIMFLANGAVVSPLEVCAAVTFGAWILHTIASDQRTFHRGSMLAPIVAFTMFVIMGLARGLSSGGDRTAALYESRALFYLPLLYVLATNLLRTPRHFHTLFGAIVGGVTINSVYALSSYLALTADEKVRLESLGEHAAALAANVVILLLATGWIYRSASRRVRLSLLVVVVPIMAAYLVAQRRAAIAGLVVAGLGLCAALYFQNRKLFWRIVPAMSLIAVLYTAAFWSASGATAFPAQAIKGVIAPDKRSASDRSSDAYRQIEAFDVVYTIRTDPLLGLGFGHRFLRPIPLPAITKFVTADYQPHNSFLWFWIKTGAFGFLTLLYLLGSLIQRGARAAVQRRDDLSLVTLISTFYVMMFATFTYLDISWDARTMVLLAMSVTLIANVDRLRADRTQAGDPRNSASLAVFAHGRIARCRQ